MKIMVMSDIHYEKDFHHRVWEGDALKWMIAMLEQHKPEDLVILGDVGYAWDKEEWETLLEKVRIHAIYGNHDNVQMLKSLRNVDRSKVWAKSGEVREIQGLKFGFINGIMGFDKELRRRKNHRYTERYGDSVTDITWVPRLFPEEYLAFADTLAAKRVDVLCTHASLPFPSDGSRFHPNEEFATLNQVLNLIKPRLWFSGHLSGPYATSWAEDSTFVRIDSSPQEQHYLLLSDKILIYHNRDLVEQVEYS